MAWNGSGTYVRTDGTYTGSTVWTKNKNAAVKITSAAHDAHDQDLATAINNCLAKDGQNAMTADLDMGNNSIINYGTAGTTLPEAESGTGTPTISGDPGTFTYNQQNTYWERIGNQVMFVTVIRGFYSGTPTGTIAITHDIGFTPVNIGVRYPCTIHHANMSTDAIIQAGVTQSGTIGIYEVGANGTQTALDGADVNGLIIEVVVSGSFIKS